jgi:hypothetical protein
MIARREDAISSEADLDPVVGGLVVGALSTFATPGAASLAGRTFDAGPAVLTALAVEAGLAGPAALGGRALEAWLDRFDGMTTHASLYGGLGALYAGSVAASAVSPRLLPLVDQLREALLVPASGPAAGVLEWQDYDLITGASGLLLVLAADPDCNPERRLAVARRLASLCDRDDLGGLRVRAYAQDRRRGWNFGRINTGVAHGVGGVVAALAAACRTSRSASDELTPALTRACRWLVAEAFVDDRGLMTWSPAGRDGTPPPAGAARRQSWCYGTPGLAWVLWDAGRTLDDRPLSDFAECAMRSFCEAFDERVYIDDGPLDDALCLCHGAAGTLAVADAFGRHAHLAQAEALAARLEGYLLDWRRDVERLALDNMTLLSGASGVLAVLLARAGGPRGWMAQVGLR